ncbi:hypothetical protein K4F52_002792 [Lecanicillium sp. MT-2017a]|nr:hypothetical protein K4F52_002792 [Lecanicillium sp. MT-2017a]
METPDDLEREYTQLQEGYPPAPIDTTRQAQTLHDILTSDTEAAAFLESAAAYPDILSLLKGTESGEHTVFVPINAAWETASADKETVAAHFSPHFVSDEGLRHMPNVPTLCTPASSNGPLVICTKLTPSGWDLNHGAAAIVHRNVRASNGIIHYLDHALLPPPSTAKTLSSNPEFSYLQKAVTLTGADILGKAPGGTLFAPTDSSFTALGSETLAFLFTSDDGLPYLRALVQMHYCPEITFLSNLVWPKNNTGGRQTSAEEARQIKGKLSQEVASALVDKQNGDSEKMRISVAISRFNGLIRMAAAGGEAMVLEQDIVANDGVIHGIQGVLTPDPGVCLPLSDGTDTLEALKRLYGPYIS